jgi:gas vesicle protein
MSKMTRLAVVAAMGVAAGILLAPKSGKETRNDLKKKVESTKKYVGDKAEQAKDMVNEAKETFNETPTRKKPGRKAK